MKDDGTLWGLGAVGLLTAAALVARGRGSRATAEKPWIYYDAMILPQLRQVSEMANELRERGVPRAVIERELIKKLMQSLPPQDQRTMRFVHAYQGSGEQVFVLGPHLQQMLVHTSLDKVPRRVLKAPYTAYYLATPQSPLRLFSQRNGWGPLRGIFFWQSGPGLWEILALGPVPGHADAYAHNMAYIPFDLDAAFASGDLEGHLVTQFAEATRIRWLNLPPDVQAELLERDLSVLRIVVNSMLYINSGGVELAADPESALFRQQRAKLEAALAALARSNERERTKKRERERLEEKLYKISGAAVVWLGPSIEASAEAEAVRAPGRKMREHPVRGHWRLVPRRPDDPVTWVRPHWRGVDAPERVTRRTYRFEAERQDDE
jgi:hypothetical protein